MTFFLASTSYESDGATSEYDFVFAGVHPDAASGTLPYLQAADVKVEQISAAVDIITGLHTVTQRDRNLILPNRIQIIGDFVPAGDTVRIYRDTEKRFPLVDYQDQQTVSELDLDLANRQCVFIAQEAYDNARGVGEISAAALSRAVDAATEAAEDAAAAAVSAASAAASAALVAPLVTFNTDLINTADPTKGAAAVGRALRWIASYAELTALVGQYDGETVYLRSRDGAHSIGQDSGEFVWQAGSAVAADDGTVLGTGSGRWIRKIPHHEIDATWFGATSALVDATAKIQAAVNAATRCGLTRIRLPGTGYFKIGALTGATGITFVGNGAFVEGRAYIVVQDAGPQPVEIVLPAAFSWLPGKIYSNGIPGQVKHTIDVEKMWLDNEVQGSVVYYVSTTGSDANSGTGINLPLLTIGAAIAKADVGTIRVFPGTYYASSNIGTAIGVSVNRDIAIQSLSGANDVILHTGANSAAITWTLNTGSTYEAIPGVAINQVFDNQYIDANGDPYRLTPRTSIALVNANPGSWWYDSAVSKVYIRLATGASPSGKVVLFGSSAGTVTGNRALFLKNIKLHGGGLNLADNGTTRPRLYAVDSEMKYGANNGWQTLAGIVYLQRCTMALSGLDNANYHDNGALASRALEVDCVSYGSGYLLSGSVSETNNASSMHDTGVVLRINGTYSRSWGPVIPDTGTCTSWNIGVTAKDALSPTATANAAFYTENGMVLIDCATAGVAYDLRVAHAATMFTRNVQTGKSILLEGTGKLQQI